MGRMLTQEEIAALPMLPPSAVMLANAAYNRAAERWRTYQEGQKAAQMDADDHYMHPERFPNEEPRQGGRT
jgi:hypothetical protein